MIYNYYFNDRKGSATGKDYNFVFKRSHVRVLIEGLKVCLAINFKTLDY